MGVKIREKIKGSGNWWVFINHKGFRSAKKVGTFADAEMVAKQFEALTSSQSLPKAETGSLLSDYATSLERSNTWE